ncbi:ankyrin repeat domain-containing protein [Uliginosibacterium gangwonense]|uniref:ankyrin repeat domain-containing protein n=1 Tax=Uliginosibacterium gangwonense TaxID=392736 RepID=UPI00036492E5|nr:ankyrin repeat domain-containing protein [Uliginosibacterium gangwonense]
MKNTIPSGQTTSMSKLEQVFSRIESVPDFSGHQITSVAYRNGWGDSPLHIVSVWGDCEAIKILLDAGADINAQGESGFTPLHYAAEQNHPAAVELLLTMGAKPLRNDDNDTPLALAEKLGHTNILTILKQYLRQAE